MKRLIKEDGREQITFLPESLDDYVAADNTIRAVDVDQLGLRTLGFAIYPATTGHPTYHPTIFLNIYLYC